MELRNQPVQGADVVMEPEGHIEACATARASRTLRSQSPSACQYVHRTGPGRPSCCPSGPGEEGQGRTLTMHDTRESDNGIVPQKPPNQEQLCLTEGGEGRPLTKGNMLQSPAARTQSRGPASRGLWRVRQAAKRDKHLRASVSRYAILRQTPEVGAVCGKSARTDLRGGCRGTGIPTAIMSQITENRKVEARKPLIFRHTILTFSLKTAAVERITAEAQAKRAA